MLEVLMPIGAAKLFLAEYEDKAVSVSIALDYEGTRGYAHTGNDPEARKLRATAPLVWAMMLDAKEHGLARFDLWGIAPEGAPAGHPWAGFTEFKRAFGGTEIAYNGTWELPLKKAKYGLWSLAKRVSS
jgi:lipid II:glycine glycyltransferase (peptidoglycan interpeptide bridge formation enzyme)